MFSQHHHYLANGVGILRTNGLDGDNLIWWFLFLGVPFVLYFLYICVFQKVFCLVILFYFGEIERDCVLKIFDVGVIVFRIVGRVVMRTSWSSDET